MLADQQNRDDERIEIAISYLLRAGLILASVLVITGGAFYLYQHGQDLPDYGSFRGEPAELKSLKGVLQSAWDFESRGIIQLGILLLILTPISRVIFSAAAFLVRRDYLYVVVTLFVLTVLIVNLLKK